MEALERARDQGDVVISEPVYSEIAAFFGSRTETDASLRDVGARLVRSTTDCLEKAGKAWKLYTERRLVGLQCSQCGKHRRPTCPDCGAALRSRQHMIADFIVGAHAMAHGGRLLTRDRGYYRTYFPDLELV